MSANLYCYALDLNRFRQVRGSRDEKLLESALSDEAGLRAHDEHVRALHKEQPFLSLAAAIRQIVTGQIETSAEPKLQFEHAASVLAASMGEPLDSEFFIETNPALWDEVDEVIRVNVIRSGRRGDLWPALSWVLSRGPFLDVPLSPGMRRTGYLTAEEVESVVRVARSIELESPDDDLTWPEDAVEGAEVYRGWVGVAAERRLGLYFHM